MTGAPEEQQPAAAAAEPDTAPDTSRELTLKDIIAADDLPRRKVAVPEWGGHVYVRTLTGTEKDALDATTVVKVKKGQGRRRRTEFETDFTGYSVKLVAAALCNGEGERMVPEGDAGLVTVEALGKKSSAALGRVVEVAQELNGVTDEDLEELEGN